MKKYEVESTVRFKKDLKLVIKRGYDISMLQSVVDKLTMGEALTAKYQDRQLVGNWSDYRECHIAPDWLLIYKIENEILVLTLTRTGSHSDLF